MTVMRGQSTIKMTHNIMYVMKREGMDGWIERKADVLSVFYCVSKLEVQERKG
jgi:hypothetical protein